MPEEAGQLISDRALFRPYVVSWNLTYRCNLACEHCYLDAGGKPKGLPILEDEAFSDRSELGTQECYKVIDDIVEMAPEAMTILTGGEPLLRTDILDIIRRASERKLWVVVGTNGVLISESLAATLAEAGVRGMALSLDALDAERHDHFRRVRGAFGNTVTGSKILAKAGMPFIIQTTVGQHNHRELEGIAEFAHDELGAKVWNLYFLVPSGRGIFTSDLTSAEYDETLATLLKIQKRFAGRMMVNAKCAPHYTRTLLEDDPASPFIKSYEGGAGGCPAGTQYLGIRPNGDVTPCPYLPVFGGNLKNASLQAIWDESEIFGKIRQRNALGERCGECELAQRCGGCRARAYGMTGDVLAEDSLCSYQPGSLPPEVVATSGPAVEYGHEVVQSIRWTPEAEERMQRIPAFVRGMVVKSVEKWCHERGISEITAEQLNEIRSRMPSSRSFGVFRS